MLANTVFLMNIKYQISAFNQAMYKCRAIAKSNIFDNKIKNNSKVNSKTKILSIEIY